MATKKNVQDAHKNKVQDAHKSAQVRELHGAMIAIVSAMNRPQRDEALMAEAGIALDRALFPLLVGIERLGPIGIVEIAERIGRDYTTVSRQVGKLESLGLVERQASATDGRVRMAVVTAKGKAMTDRLDRARERIAQDIFGTWEPGEFDDLVRLIRKFADALESS